MRYDDPGYVTEQYRDASNLGARLALHSAFSTNEHPWQRWIFDHFDLPDGARVLDVGCGPGTLWAENLGRLPAGWKVLLTDRSEGMLREARNRLGFDERFGFEEADAQDLPFGSDGFDAVVANHVLYHVPDRERALAGISRVLKPGGALYATTNGQDHNREMGRMLRVLEPSRPDDGYPQAQLGFGLENGEEQLSRWFPHVSLHRREDSLMVTEVAPLLDYLLSGTAAHAAGETLPGEAFDRRVSELAGHLEREMAARGGIHVTKDSGLFVARGRG